MEVSQFEAILKGLKKSQKMTGYNFKVDSIRLITPLIFKWYYNSPRNRFKDSRLWAIKLELFKEPKYHLSVFEVGMLNAIFCDKVIPADYASYHKCPYGKEFIENIKSIEVI